MQSLLLSCQSTFYKLKHKNILTLGELCCKVEKTESYITFSLIQSDGGIRACEDTATPKVSEGADLSECKFEQ